MDKETSTYNSHVDWFAWVIVAFTAAVCSLPIFMGETVLGLLLIALFVMMELVAFYGISYHISGDELTVKSFARRVCYPISEITEIQPTNSWLAVPASSLTKRIAISFNRGVLPGSIPLIISPAHQDKFISQLLSINPSIKVKSKRS